MRILLVNPEKLINPPLGLLYIGSMLKHSGHETKIAEIPFGLNDNDRFNAVRKEIERSKPGMVGITCMSMQADITKSLIKRMKENFPDIAVVVGGVHPTVDSDEALSWGADIAVRGEGDNTVLEIVKHLEGGAAIGSISGISYRADSGFMNNPDRMLIKDLDELPPISYDLLGADRFKRRSYSIRGFWLRCGWVMTTRGCPGRCTFCASKTMHRRVVREFAIDRILDEVERLNLDYEIEGLWIFDDTFTLKEKRVVDFCEGLKKRKIGIIWACQARVDTFNPVMAKAMKSARCVQVDFGVESGSQKVLNAIKKDIRCDQTRRAFKIARESGLRTLATVMVGLPEEGADDLKMTEDLIREIRPNFVAPFFAAPYPGTELYDTARAKGWIDKNKKINWQQMEEPLMTIDMPSEDIKRALERLLDYNSSVFFDYLRQPRFLIDFCKIFLKYPKYLFRFAACLIRGKKNDAINMFLYLFRKEMIGPS